MSVHLIAEGARDSQTVKSGIDWKDKLCLPNAPNCAENLVNLRFSGYNGWGGPANNGSENLIYAFNDDATNHGTWDRSIAEPSQHDRLDSRGGRVEDAISDVIACKDSPDLSAIGTPPRIVHGDAFAAASLGP